MKAPAAPALPSQKFNFVFFSKQWHMNLYLWCYIVDWTECNNRHKYYHNNLHNSQFMDIFGHGREFRVFYRFAWNKTYLRDLYHNKLMENTSSEACAILCSINFIKRILSILVLTYIC